MSWCICQHKGSTNECHLSAEGLVCCCNTSALGQLFWDQRRKLPLRAPNLCMFFLLSMPSSCRASPASGPGHTSSGQPSTLGFIFSQHEEKLQCEPSLTSSIFWHYLLGIWAGGKKLPTSQKFWRGKLSFSKLSINSSGNIS